MMPAPAYLQAKAAADMARINLNYTHIAAPISGRIGASSVTEGALVTASQTTALATISTLDPIYVDVDQSVPKWWRCGARCGRAVNQAPALSAEVTLKLDDGSTIRWKGKLQFTDVTVDPTTGAVRLRAIFPNPDSFCCPAFMCAPPSIRAWTRTASWRRTGRQPRQKGQPTALVVDAKNIARLRVLRTGRAVGGDWQVLDGLKPGDRHDRGGPAEGPARHAGHAAARAKRRTSSRWACRASSSTARSSPGSSPSSSCWRAASPPSACRSSSIPPSPRRRWSSAPPIPAPMPRRCRTPSPR